MHASNPACSWQSCSISSTVAREVWVLLQRRGVCVGVALTVCVCGMWLMATRGGIIIRMPLVPPPRTTVLRVSTSGTIAMTDIVSLGHGTCQNGELVVRDQHQMKH